MCLILFANDVHPEYPLIFAGNRDEFYDRPTAPAAFWDDAPHVLAGRDRKAGGTWLGITRRGHWATVTNVRDERPHREDAPSRGRLVADYLRDEPAPDAYLEDVEAEADQYNGFNLLVGTAESTFYYSNRDGTPRPVQSGIHGMSNAQLDDPWPKVERGTSRLDTLCNEDEPSVEAFFDVLDDRRPAPDENLPQTGVGRETERMLSPPFIDGDEAYGTRASTVFLVHRSGHVTFAERSFDGGISTETRDFTFDVTSRVAS
ncbi:NRDE family protein [Salinibacter grassmerensis]|uniref:NRDE family protein n=1 Tax=Salinibacter grassmerensis TaxID=3040353 RepID=UPI0021E6FE52|nr:NRDE family protein [Salinibacter grassmerensis]